ncbi:MAG TPA: 2-C-methyl-D-erythritol 2,4-cyclodiphosphate synthase, partial [Bacteroidales bacterium]|nr:2-C-methyl-D-erythritol 2,4-cyclodiphosphate synthase [Bacteroidales bacterium]
MNLRIGQGIDFHRLENGLSLWIGGVLIPSAKGCVAHSDGDVL